MHRLKAKRSKYNNAGGQPDKTSVCICYRTPCLCSCWMCANHRDVFGMSINKIGSSILEGASWAKNAMEWLIEH
ncbi:hypothetical protein ABLA30_14410 [Xenorhabdus nematophila]|uniref:Uncharacterized protein n=1 Tax=Xenorhabdus nematophila (strain ATCC 19061 / DSM 3370 / CCUG 14189 / LMG 1036 / NCIMB 9965 / AN6) TaxID=406817 RepID=D3VH85_XENNA|nr:hypothetical protein [Xenorhabdus nematophila]CBJ90530.1 hypothetical protein XNC1_2471 [Xenorhabdus nematophila ATCC 19061]CEK23371.1 hypothetical protein XNC2_2377 [Xenorhabdus nematophila AN6/1]